MQEKFDKVCTVRYSTFRTGIEANITPPAANTRRAKIKDHIMGCEDAIGFFQALLRGILDNAGGGGGVDNSRPARSEKTKNR
jgi:hypothetical protein